MKEALFLLLILACPLMMVWMMRGGHRHGSNADDCDSGEPGDSMGDLRRRRDELDRLIAEREADEERAAPIGGKG